MERPQAFRFKIVFRKQKVNLADLLSLLPMNEIDAALTEDSGTCVRLAQTFSDFRIELRSRRKMEESRHGNVYTNNTYVNCIS